MIFEENCVLKTSEERHIMGMVSGFCHGVKEIFTILGCYAMQTGS